MPVLGVMDERVLQYLNLIYEIWVKGRDLHMDLFFYLIYWVYL